MQTESRSSSLPAKQDRAQRTELWGPFGVFAPLYPASLASLRCRWYVAFRSFCGHIRIQSSTSGGRVDLGPALQVRSGQFQPNERTQARARGIEKLRAIHPWADIVDLRIFLMGFDAGAEFCTDSLAEGRSNREAQNTVPPESQS